MMIQLWQPLEIMYLSGLCSFGFLVAYLGRIFSSQLSYADLQKVVDMVNSHKFVLAKGTLFGLVPELSFIRRKKKIKVKLLKTPKTSKIVMFETRPTTKKNQVKTKRTLVLSTLFEFF